MKARLKKHPASSYLFIILAWVCLSIAAIYWMDQSQESALSLTTASSILTSIVLLIYLFMPCISAVIVARAEREKIDIRRILQPRPFQSYWKMLLFSLLMFYCVQIIKEAVSVLFTLNKWNTTLLSPPKYATVNDTGPLPAPLAIVFLLIPFSIAQELGWRGFLLPRLLKKHSLFQSGVMIGAAWTIWYTPLYYMEVPGNGFLRIAVFFLLQLGIMTALSLIMAHLYGKAKGGLLPGILIHYTYCVLTAPTDGLLFYSFYPHTVSVESAATLVLLWAIAAFLYLRGKVWGNAVSSPLSWRRLLPYAVAAALVVVVVMDYGKHAAISRNNHMGEVTAAGKISVDDDFYIHRVFTLSGMRYLTREYIQENLQIDSLEPYESFSVEKDLEDDIATVRMDARLFRTYTISLEEPFTNRTARWIIEGPAFTFRVDNTVFGLNTPIEITFSKPVPADEISEHMQVISAHQAAFSVVQDGMRVTLCPKEPLIDREQYTLRFGSDMRSEDGTRLGRVLVYSLTPRKEDDPPPNVRDPLPKVLPFLPQDLPHRADDLLTAPGREFEEIPAAWLITQQSAPGHADDTYNQFTHQTQTDEAGKYLRESHISINPRTGREIALTYGRDAEGTGSRLSVALDGESIFTQSDYDAYGGLSCQWLSDTQILYRTTYFGSFLYDMHTGERKWFCYPFGHTVPVTEDGAIDWENLPEGMAVDGLLAVDAANTCCLYTVFPDTGNADERRRTIYYYNWDTGVYFPILDEPMYSPGTDVPIHLQVSAEFESAGIFWFSVDNSYNLNNQGEDIGDAYFRVDVPSRTVTRAMTVGTDTSYRQTLGDYRVYYRQGQKDEGADRRDVSQQIILYNWRTGELALQLDGRIVTTWGGRAIVVAAANTTHVIDLINRRNYVLDNSGLMSLYPGKEFDFTSSRIRAYNQTDDQSETSFLPDVETFIAPPFGG